jgi:hypothetical protein
VMLQVPWKWNNKHKIQRRNTFGKHVDKLIMVPLYNTGLSKVFNFCVADSIKTTEKIMNPKNTRYS